DVSRRRERMNQLERAGKSALFTFGDSVFECGVRTGPTPGFRPKHLCGELRQSPFAAQRLGSRRVKDELRDNLMSRLREGSQIFPGIVGYDDTVVPQIVNAILSRHNFILLGLRGQAKSRILRALTALLDPEMPYVAGCEIHDNPYAPICRRCRELVAKEADATPITWLTPDHRYVEKLATPDVTIADL